MENTTWNVLPPSILMRAIKSAWVNVGTLWRVQGKRRSLLVKETAGLGERRFVAVVQFEQQRFLVGGGPGSVALLARLRDAEQRECNRE